MKNIAGILTSTILLTASGLSLASAQMPWAFNSGKGEGYSISLESVTPAPGTPVVVGTPVMFKVTVRYENTLTPKASVILVFQTEKGSAKPEGEPQVTQEVTEKTGTVTLEELLVIPKKGKELRLFIPVVPDGLKKTSGEVVIRWPIKKK